MPLSPDRTPAEHGDYDQSIEIMNLKKNRAYSILNATTAVWPGQGEIVY
jgi:hypothetical protein